VAYCQTILFNRVSKVFFVVSVDQSNCFATFMPVKRSFWLKDANFHKQWPDLAMVFTNGDMKHSNKYPIFVCGPILLDFKTFDIVISRKG
jgi:hypothetical protein